MTIEPLVELYILFYGMSMVNGTKTVSVACFRNLEWFNPVPVMTLVIITVRYLLSKWLNLSEVGNLIVSKTSLISQLGYLISMMDCPEELMKTMQEDIDRFIFRTGKNPWMAKDRRYLPPKEGGMGAINITIYANSLRCSWYKRINSGLVMSHT